MPVELGIWRIDGDLRRMEFAPLDFEARLQEILTIDISIVDPNLMVIGREVKTSYEHRIDLLAINRDGNLVAIELKRNKTPRDIVAQLLDYGGWIRQLRDDDIARIFGDFQRRYHPEAQDRSINEAFCERFNIQEMPDELNERHELIIVASYLDPATERIVGYLADEYEVQINAVFFRVFKDGDNEYLTRAWLREPTGSAASGSDRPESTGEWNGEYYVSFGQGRHRRWADAVKYGFISAGGGSWYTNTLGILEPGARIWVNIPGQGYVGVGRVTEGAVPINEFKVHHDGKNVPILDLPLEAPDVRAYLSDPEKIESLVGVQWIKTVPIPNAIKEKGFFGNQNTVARPTSSKWAHTVERLRIRFGID